METEAYSPPCRTYKSKMQFLIWTTKSPSISKKLFLWISPLMWTGWSLRIQRGLMKPCLTISSSISPLALENSCLGVKIKFTLRLLNLTKESFSSKLKMQVCSKSKATRPLLSSRLLNQMISGWGSSASEWLNKIAIWRPSSTFASNFRNLWLNSTSFSPLKTLSILKSSQYWIKGSLILRRLSNWDSSTKPTKTQFWSLWIRLKFINNKISSKTRGGSRM